MTTLSSSANSTNLSCIFFQFVNYAPPQHLVVFVGFVVAFFSFRYVDFCKCSYKIFLFWFKFPSLISIDPFHDELPDLFVLHPIPLPTGWVPGSRLLLSWGALRNSRKSCHTLGTSLSLPGFLSWHSHNIRVEKMHLFRCPQLVRGPGNQLFLQGNIHSSKAHERSLGTLWHHEATAFFLIFTLGHHPIQSLIWLNVGKVPHRVCPVLFTGVILIQLV